MRPAGGNDTCKRIRELAVWYPVGTLDKGEREQVEEHVAKCPACADLLKFASAFRGLLQEQYAFHPAVDALVSFAENRAAMDAQQCARIEEHLSICPECREQLKMLEAVEESSAGEAAPRISESHKLRVPVGSRSRLGSFWDSLKGGILKPIPAAVYLIVAVLAVGFHMAGQSRWLVGESDREASDIVVRSDTGLISDVLSGVVILPDQTERMREVGSGEIAGVPIGVGRAQFLLLELTGLEAPPAEEDQYTVEILPEGLAQPVFTGAIMGWEFRENYTICLSLAEGALTPGDYAVRVTGPDGNPVFHSSIVAR